MRSNQKYTKEEMYVAIEQWKESGQSQTSWCQKNNMCRSTLKYWLKKYHQENASRINKKSSHKYGPTSSFIPIDITTHDNIGLPPDNQKDIIITYPTGI
jgi:transposase-like protein